MKLYSKTSLVLILQLIVAVVVISAFFTIISLSNYEALERQYVERDVNQALNHIESELVSLSALVSDWAPWDDTVAFVNGTSPDYLTTNLMPESSVYHDIRVNLILIADHEGDIVYSGFYDSVNGTMGPIPEVITGQLTPRNPLMRMNDATRATTGIIMVDGDPMLVASRPIVRTDYSGDPQGVVIMGKYLDAQGIASPFRSISGPSLQYIPADRNGFPASVLDTAGDGESGQSKTVLALNADVVAGYALVKDIHGLNAFVLQITEPRSIYQQGINTTFQFILILLALWLGSGVVIMITVDRIVLGRLDSIRQQVRAVVQGKDASVRIEARGDDELSALAEDINRTLETIYATQEQLVLSERRFRETANLLPQIIFEVDGEGRLTYVNKLGYEVFGLTDEDVSLHPPARTFFIEEDRERLMRNLQRVARGEDSAGEIYGFRGKDGKTIRGVISSEGIFENGTFVGIRGSIFDLTERLVLEEALMESQDYLESLLFSVPAGILVIDATTHAIVDANPAALAMINIPRSELVGRPYQDFMYPLESERDVPLDTAQPVLNVEGILKTKSGEERSIIKYIVPVSLKGRSCLLQTFIDNSERKKMEEELRHSTELISGILQASPVGVCQLDLHGRFTFANEMFFKITGLSLETIRGKYWTDVLDPGDRKKLMEEVEDTVRERRPFTAETRYLHPDGSVYWLSGQAVPITDHSHRATGWVGTIADITERRTIEDALRESEEKYRALTEYTPDLLFSADLNGIITYVSPQVNQYGYLEEDLVGRSIFSIIHPDERPQIATDLIREINNNAQFSATFRIFDRWGNILWFEERSFLRLDSFGKPIGIYGVMRDISERKRAEDAIELANKKLNLMNNITRHDILNTITGLFGCVDMANATDSVDERRVLLEDIRHLTGLIQRQIAFTKEYQEVGVHLPLWQNVIEILHRIRDAFENTGIVIDIDLENAEIYADPLLEKVFYNLVDNAIRYGEKITTIRFFLLISDEGLTLVCEDDGIGIPPQYKYHIFERGVGTNTGMGLFLSREILGITKISIAENGIYGHGARFEMFTPRGTYRFLP
jgi:PAS domain S-box-containing protein